MTVDDLMQQIEETERLIAVGWCHARLLSRSGGGIAPVADSACARLWSIRQSSLVAMRIAKLVQPPHEPAGAVEQADRRNRGRAPSGREDCPLVAKTGPHPELERQTAVEPLSS
jgi:hypothetical protein